MEFYGRQDILNLLDKRADALAKGYRQNIAIIADELLGKTCLIQHWLSKRCDNFTVPVYIEVKFQDFSAFLEKFIGTLLFSFLKNSQVALRDDISYLIDKSKRYIPRSCSFIEELLSERKKKNSRESFARLLELTEIFYAETNKSCIIILDEFHLLEKLNIKDMYPCLRKHLMLHTHTMYILLSSRKQLSQEILSADLSLLFGNFEKIELQPFDNRTASVFVQDKLGPLAPCDEIKNFIISLCSSNPFYLNVVCNAFTGYHAKYASAVKDADSFVSSLENIFIDEWGVLNRRFLELMQKIECSFKDQTFVKVLSALSAGINNASQIAQYAGKPRKEISFLLTQLFLLEAISKNADIYYLKDRILGLWLRCIYVNRLSAFSIDKDMQKQLFRKEMRMRIAQFCEAQSKGVGARILELFNQFSDESVEMHKKRIRLNRFKEVKLLDISGRRLKEGIVARAKDGLWIAGLKMDKVEEEDIIEFAGICKKLKYNKPQKRIFIAFDDIDINARLIAKEEKISTWEAAFINSLLDIYDKPRVVR
jgi:hypothetical protein